jgi:hypothetical protein
VAERGSDAELPLGPAAAEMTGEMVLPSGGVGVALVAARGIGGRWRWWRGWGGEVKEAV